jgi:glycosyltransferase involved in cell wall biosynthesis
MNRDKPKPESRQISDEETIKVSLVIPVLDEAATIGDLLVSIAAQTRQPDEVVIVDGGSKDGTLKILREARAGNPKIRVLEASKASPGLGRNIGISNARYEWIALTDAGIRLDPQWLANLVAAARAQPDLDIICGTFEPEIDSFFKECAAIAYVPIKTRLTEGIVRGPFIASSLVKRQAWYSVGGFPDLRASEDLIFFDELQRKGCKMGWAPGAVVHWELRPTLGRTMRRFTSFSSANVWGGQKRRWHYVVLGYYLVSVAFVVLAVFMSAWWLLVPITIQLARVGKNIWFNRQGTGLFWVLNPLRFAYVMLITVAIDLATLTGWLIALLKPGEAKRIRNHMLTRQINDRW